MTEPNSLYPSATMCAAIGAFSISWAELEVGMDFVVLMVFHHLGGNKVDKQCPKQISRKIEHIRDCAKKSPQFQKWASRAASLMDEVDLLVDERHNLTHGVIHTVGPGEQIVLIRLIHDKKGFHTGEEHTVTLEMLRQTTLKTRALTKQILAFGFELLLAQNPRPEVVEQLRKMGIQNA